MKTTIHKTFVTTEDESSLYYNWSERTAVFFRPANNQSRVSFINMMIDLVCMAAITTAVLNCL